jgi:hypothetical protein
VIGNDCSVFYISSKKQKITAEGERIMAKSAKIICVRCGEELNEKNAFYAETDSGYNPYCIKCQQEYFNRLQSTSGTHLALYFCCIKYDVPCNPLVLPENVNSKDFLESEDAQEGIWIYYLRQIEQTKLYEEGEETPNFFDGVTNILRIFGKNFTERDFARFVQYEQEMFESLEGTERQRARWGNDYTTDEYTELDRLYSALMEFYKGWSLNPQQENTIKTVAELDLKIKALIKDNKHKDAKDSASLRKMLLEGDGLLAKDAKQTEQMKVDALVKSLENNGLMKEGKLLTFDETIDALLRRLKAKKYPMTVDAVHKMIFTYVNAFRANADEEMLTSLPNDMNLEDCKSEFEDDPSEEEIAKIRYAGLTTVQFEE